MLTSYIMAGDAACPSLMSADEVLLVVVFVFVAPRRRHRDSRVGCRRHCLCRTSWRAVPHVPYRRCRPERLPSLSHPVIAVETAGQVVIVVAIIAVRTIAIAAVATVAIFLAVDVETLPSIPLPSHSHFVSVSSYLSTSSPFSLFQT